MPRVTAVIRIEILYLIAIMLVWYIGLTGYAVSAGERHTLIIANEDEGNKMHILELKLSGEIVTTANQTFNSFYDGIGVRPDQCVLWATAYGGIQQYAISPEGLITTTGRFIADLDGSVVKFTPNGEMLLAVGPIYRAYPDGSVENTMNTYTSTLYLSPRGDINIRKSGSVFYVDKIDYDTFSINSIQKINIQPSDVAYTPDGNYIAIGNNGDPISVDVFIYPILSDGSLDTAHCQTFNFGTVKAAWAFSAAVSIDGRFFYFGDAQQNQIEIIRQVTPGVFEDTGMRVYTGYWSWQLAVSPDGKYLVANDHHVLETFEIQEDGNLVSVFKFPFETTFGYGPHYFQFAYPPAPTAIDTLNWELYQ